MISFRTIIFLLLIVVSASAATTYAAAHKVERNATVTSADAAVAVDPISVGTENGGTVSDLFVRDGQSVVTGDTLLTLKSPAQQGTEKIIAQHTGVVENLQVTKDSFVKPSSELLELIDPENLFVSAHLKVTADQFLQLHSDMPVTIQIGTTSQFAGKITGIVPRYDAANEMATVYCSFSDATDRQRLVPGLPAEVSLILPSASLDFVHQQLSRLHL